MPHGRRRGKKRGGRQTACVGSLGGLKKPSWGYDARGHNADKKKAKVGFNKESGWTRQKKKDRGKP